MQVYAVRCDRYGGAGGHNVAIKHIGPLPTPIGDAVARQLSDTNFLREVQLQVWTEWRRGAIIIPFMTRQSTPLSSH